MKRVLATLAVLLMLVVLGAVLLVSQRHRLLIAVAGSGSVPPLLEAGEEDAGATWFDDYYFVQALDERTFAIGEPRYHQQNFNYLILGDRRAVLFDAGPGVRDVRPVVESLTDLPVTFIPSHLHYDHTGNSVKFERVALLDLPHLRSRAESEVLQLTWQEHLGKVEGIDAPALEVAEWLIPGSSLDLGGRDLAVLHTPGHTESSVSLLDRQSGYLFSGDFLYPGPVYAFVPSSNLGDYIESVQAVLAEAASIELILGAHRVGPPGLPTLTVADVRDLEQTLFGLRDGSLAGEGLYPVTFEVNRNMTLLVEPAWLRSWEPRQPASP